MERNIPRARKVTPAYNSLLCFTTPLMASATLSLNISYYEIFVLILDSYKTSPVFLLVLFFYLSNFAFGQSQDLPESISFNNKEFFFVPVQQNVEFGAEIKFLAHQGFAPASSDYLSDVP